MREGDRRQFQSLLCKLMDAHFQCGAFGKENEDCGETYKEYHERAKTAQQAVYEFLAAFDRSPSPPPYRLTNSSARE
jgi:hypothetical protein